MLIKHKALLLLSLLSLLAISAKAEDVEVMADLVTPAMTDEAPAAGKRVRQVVPEYEGTEVYHSLYLPVDWKPGGKYPVIVEYTGRRFPPGKGTGEVKDANLGYGMSGGQGFIWVTMPCVEKGRQENAVNWWGDKQATIDYCKINLPRICKQFGGDPDNVFICGFSRGAIGASYIGLADDEIAALWKGLFTHDHFDGQKKWGYPESDCESALKRLARLKGRPVLVGGQRASNVHEQFLKEHLDLADFSFLDVPVNEIFNIPEGPYIHSHTDLWMHRESKYRKQARAWLQDVLSEKSDKPNVLFIAIDDLNDWIGCLGGHPQAKTPHFDRLASRGVLFTNAHCQSSVCNPSRASLMASLYPSTSGIYFLNPDLGESPVARKSTLMPQRFQTEGYHVTGAGKLFHNGGKQNEKYLPNYGGQFGGFGPRPNQKLSSYPGHPLWDWGAFPERDEQMPDFKIASWAVAELMKQHDRPLFLAAGFYRPHVPQFAPQEWFDLYPLETLQLPKTIANDLHDISQYGIDLTRLEHVAPTHEWVTNNDEWKPLVQSYLACVSFVDAQVGRVLAALEESEYADNTYIVLLSDHGFHLGEKQRWAKRSLWQDGTGVPLMIVGPGVAQGGVCDKPVQLLDIYPTLLDLTGMKSDPKLEGQSLKPLLENPQADWPHMARCSFGPGNVAIISERYRYIRYRDSSEELYDRQADPHEWVNLVVETGVDLDALNQHREMLPKTYHPVFGSGSTGHRAFEATEKNHGRSN